MARLLKPLTDEITERYKNHNKAVTKDAAVNNEKRWFLAVDSGLGYGEPATIISGVILIPIMITLAFILPGNKALPVVDLVSIPFMVETMIAVTNGNILKTVVNAAIWFSLGLYMGSYLAPIYTHAVAQYGVALPVGAVLIISFNDMCRPLNGLIFLAWVSGKPLWIGLTIVVYIILQVLLRTRRAQIWQYLRTMAERNIS